jgi:hypothetical protein
VARNRRHTTKMKKDKLNKKATVSRSPAMICSADAPSKDVKQETSKLIKREIRNIHIEQELPDNGYFKLTISSLEIEWEE